MLLLLLYSLPHQFQALARDFNVSPISLPTVLLETVKNIDDVSNLGQVDGPIPCPFIGFLQFIYTRANRLHAARLRCRLPADLKLPKRKSERPFDLIGKARQRLQRIPLKMNLSGLLGFLFGCHHADSTASLSFIQDIL